MKHQLKIFTEKEKRLLLNVLNLKDLDELLRGEFIAELYLIGQKQNLIWIAGIVRNSDEEDQARLTIYYSIRTMKRLREVRFRFKDLLLIKFIKYELKGGEENEIT